MLSALREQVREVIATWAAPAIRTDLVSLLGRPGYALHAEGLCRAGTLALDVHEAVFREPPGRSAMLAAAALELQMEAAYLFDEVADAAPYASRSEDLALAIALLTAGGAAAVEAASISADPSDALRHFCMDYNEACAGQFLDAMLQRRGEATLEEALQMTCLKSGGLGKFVTGFAARIAGVDPVGVTLFEQLGSDSFTVAQLVDDLRDACAPGPDSDLSQRKATLPIVYFRQGIDSLAPFDGMLSPDIHQIYESSGAPLYAAILARAYMSRAQQDLSLLARRAYAVGGLGRFLKSVESGAEEILGAARVGLVA
jgi:geranylgeranyl pyrophosphate synthase